MVQPSDCQLADSLVQTLLSATTLSAPSSIRHTAQTSSRRPMAADFQPSIFHYAGIIRRQAWLVVLVVVVTVAAAGLALSQETSIYRASSKIVVGQNGGVFQAQFGNAVDPFTQTMTNLLKSEVVARRVIDNTNLKITTGTLLKRTHVVARPNESVLEVSYDTPDRATAVAVLRQIDDVFAQLVKDRLGTVPTTGSDGNG